MHSRIGWIVLFLVASIVNIASADRKSECTSDLVDEYWVSWCHDWDPNVSSTEIIYFFHGLGQNAKVYRKSILPKVLQAKNSAAHILSVSFGRTWFLSDVSGFRDSRLKAFEEKFQPMLETALGFTPTKRILVGESMGGFSAIRLAHDKPDMFDQVIAMCPAVMPYSPYWSKEQKEEYLNAHPEIDRKLIAGVTPFALYEFPSEDAWNRNNPFEVSKGADYAIPKIVLSSNSEDPYGFAPGIIEFSHRLQSFNKDATLIEEPGGHCHHLPDYTQKITDLIDL